MILNATTGAVVEINGDEWEKSVVTEENSNNEGRNGLSKSKPLRTRSWCLTSYIPEGDIESYLRCEPWVQHWAVASHDKDLKEDGTVKDLHTHILLYTYEAKTSTAILKKFDNLARFVASRDGGVPQNTLVQRCNSMSSQWRYLIHQDETDPNKYHYDKSIRTCDDFSYWNKLDYTYGLNDSSTNYGMAIYEDVMAGVSTRELIQRYGKEYIYHAHHYKACVVQTFKEEVSRFRGEDILDVDITNTVLPLLLENSTFSKEVINNFWIVLDYLKSECLLTYNQKCNIYLSEGE